MIGNGVNRIRWAALGAAIAVSVGGGVTLVATASGAGRSSSFVPIVACRLADTRSGESVGARSTPVGAGETALFQVTGTNGGCTITASATAITSNVTVVNPTASSFLTVFAADATRPLASNLNWTTLSSPTPNQVTVSLSATGTIKIFNNVGDIDVVIDIVGYYEPAVTGPAGPAGPTGATGVAGVAGVAGPKGDAGVTGLTGARGDTGDAGVTGLTGARGDRGDAGVTGLTGARGDRGDAGTTGLTGPKGDAGAAGVTGSTGPKGDTGARGIDAGLGGVAFNESTAPALLVTPTLLSTVTITAPTAGFVIVSATATILSATGVTTKCGISKTLAFETIVGLNYSVAGGISSQWTGLRGYPLDAGVTTFNLLCSSSVAPPGGSSASFPVITVVFSATAV